MGIINYIDYKLSMSHHGEPHHNDAPTPHVNPVTSGCCHEAYVTLDHDKALICCILNCIPFFFGCGTYFSACLGSVLTARLGRIRLVDYRLPLDRLHLEHHPWPQAVGNCEPQTPLITESATSTSLCFLKSNTCIK